jgi:hypothetical protein
LQTKSTEWVFIEPEWGWRVRFTPDFAIENLLQVEIPANTGISSIFLFIVGVATLSKKNLAGIPVFIGLSTLITISTA